jgi:hypothetical protein
MKHKILKSLPLIAFFVVAALPLFAQKSNPNVPIDGGLSILLASGAGYAIKKIKDKRKEK